MKEEKFKGNNPEKNGEIAKKTVGTGMIILIILSVLVTATFAWYVYQTGIKTNKVNMAAGTSTNLEISDAYNGNYSSSVNLSAVYKTLDPVSTDIIQNGFQTVKNFEEIQGNNGKVTKIAADFHEAPEGYYLKTTLYLRTNAPTAKVYACNLQYDEDDEAKNIAAAMRVGYVIHNPGEGQAVENEYIFVLSDRVNEGRLYNTKKGQEGGNFVLDSTKTDGSVVDSPALGLDKLVSYDKSTNVMTKGDDAKQLFLLQGGAESTYGTPVQVDVYLWLEGCDPDCVEIIGNSAMNNIALTFAAY